MSKHSWKKESEKEVEGKSAVAYKCSKCSCFWFIKLNDDGGLEEHYSLTECGPAYRNAPECQIAITDKRMTMKSATLPFGLHQSLSENAETLAKTLKGRFSAPGEDFKGYRFFFSHAEQSTHKRMSKKFQIDCFEMMRNARKEGKSVQIFRNANGELACKLA